jgi:hypothetical protein
MKKTILFVSAMLSACSSPPHLQKCPIYFHEEPGPRAYQARNLTWCEPDNPPDLSTFGWSGG